MKLKWCLGFVVLAACSTSPKVTGLGESDGRIVRRSYANDPSPMHSMASFESELNIVRRRHGLGPVFSDDRLMTAASTYARQIQGRQGLSHVGPDGSTPEIRVSRAGYRWSFIGENLANGFLFSNDVITGWMHSAGHRANMLDPRASEYGFAVIEDTWVLLLGRPR